MLANQGSIFLFQILMGLDCILLNQNGNIDSLIYPLSADKYL